MELTVIGCRSGMPADGEASSGYVVRGGDTRVLLDCGPGVVAGLGGPLGGLAPADLDAVVVSHLHLDHCHDLLPLGKALLSRHIDYPGGPPRSAEAPHPVPLLVPAGAGETLRRWAALFPVGTMPLLDRSFDVAFDVHEYTPGETVTVGELDLTLHLLRHAVPDCGVRVDDGETVVAYTGDTGVTDGLVDLARDADLLVAEASLDRTDTGSHGHLSGADAGRAAARAGARELLLTHWTTSDPAWRAARGDDARAVFDGPVHLALPGSSWTTARNALATSTHHSGSPS